jgi:uncharacterized protein YdeI (YjbR/CyaY-like superfamily)
MLKASRGEPVLSFGSARAWGRWLERKHTGSGSVWLRLRKKTKGRPVGLSYAQALDEALCWGWIDSHKRAADEMSWLQRFGPRRPRSVWSRVNTKHAERLMRDGRMRAPGLAEVEAARKDGRWERAYEPPSSKAVPADFLEKLSKSKKAEAFFRSLNRANVYAITFRLQTAKKPETRKRRLEQILAMMARGEKFHP